MKMTIDSGEFRTGESSHLLFSPYCSSTKLLEDIFWLGRKAHGNAEREKKKLLLLISSLLLTWLPACLPGPPRYKNGVDGKKVRVPVIYNDDNFHFFPLSYLLFRLSLGKLRQKALEKWWKIVDKALIFRSHFRPRLSLLPLHYFTFIVPSRILYRARRSTVYTVYTVVYDPGRWIWDWIGWIRRTFLILRPLFLRPIHTY